SDGRSIRRNLVDDLWRKCPKLCTDYLRISKFWPIGRIDYAGRVFTMTSRRATSSTLRGCGGGSHDARRSGSRHSVMFVADGSRKGLWLRHQAEGARPQRDRSPVLPRQGEERTE